MNRKRLYSPLAHAGALPFIACAAAHVLGLDAPGPLGEPAAIARAYGLAIASFLAGAHWGVCLARPDAAPASLFVISNAIVVAAWLACVFAPPVTATGVLIASFVCLLAVDARLRTAGLIDGDYLRLRAIVSAIVVVALAVLLVPA